ncbi:PTS N-acetylmuramic acid transporter subunit IIBC [Paraburkholderia sp. 22099]|jgi:N-acetylmuramic acid PTS system EIICB component|uniref:PTS system N-acetylmuramic acid-specific EIIBC component n=2 Tax=Paraburkholderia terricola TaxID=169427 RepID=A0A1M6K4D1_9BURK|nr:MULTISPECIES: PTS N-acetylmuramic acid transporter subunit IIBC [Paraburkholderia]AXE95935.1 PTS N-acetylmuramic acid transporter subunits IIBC [Paraburkholderia terricola]ORC51589.1 PTS N-acetylmuramic acid transporter subunits IIBC [Burkholderia sp. A27]SDN73166.1 PTS system, N-acetylmuramic acid-specific IIC component [Paraburkholderia sediminicola]SHJ53797.1 PTS system, N-acetylmuramic acid-specific IIC component [Paraburkholderia terricola]
MQSINETTAQEILDAIGGPANVVRCSNCMTRLRFVLGGQDRVDTAALKRIACVQGVLAAADQLQVVIGAGKVQRAADLVKELLAKHESRAAPEAPVDNAADQLAAVARDNKKAMKARHGTRIHQFLSKFATIFTPLIPGFLGAGLLLGGATLIEQAMLANVLDRNPTIVHLVAYMNVFGKGLFGFLGILVGYNTQQAFGGSGVNGAILASLFLLDYGSTGSGSFHAGIQDFFGLQIDPRGSIIGILIAGIAGAWIEQQIRRRMPANLDMILTSLLTLLIAGALTYVVIMPVGVLLFDGMSWLFGHLNDNPIGAALLSGLFLIAVMFGVHQGFIPVYFALMQSRGFNSLFPILAMAGAGQVGAAIALYVRAPRESVLRKQIKGAIVPALLGVGEPLIYGVTLPRVKPFISACFGGAVGGFVIGLFAWFHFPIGLNTVFGPSGLVSLPLITSDHGALPAMAIYLVGIFSAYLAGFAFTYAWGCRDVDMT